MSKKSWRINQETGKREWYDVEDGAEAEGTCITLAMPAHLSEDQVEAFRTGLQTWIDTAAPRNILPIEHW